MNFSQTWKNVIIVMANFLKMKKLLYDQGLRPTITPKIVKCYIYLVLLYGLEAGFKGQYNESPGGFSALGGCLALGVDF